MKEKEVQNVHGWDSELEVASEIYESNFRTLLEGQLVFAYKNLKKTGSIKLLVVSRVYDGFRFGLLPLGSSWTEFHPRCSKKYLEEIVYKDLVENKTEKFIIEDFLELIKRYE